jgi:hypothetical protein
MLESVRDEGKIRYHHPGAGQRLPTIRLLPHHPVGYAMPLFRHM